MLLSPNESWDRAMKSAEAFHEYAEIDRQIRVGMTRLEQGLGGWLGRAIPFRNSPLFLGVLLVFVLFRAKTFGEVIDEIQELNILSRRVALLQREQEAIFNSKVTRSFLYLLLRRTPNTRHLP